MTRQYNMRKAYNEWVSYFPFLVCRVASKRWLRLIFLIFIIVLVFIHRKCLRIMTMILIRIMIRIRVEDIEIFRIGLLVVIKLSFDVRVEVIVIWESERRRRFFLHPLIFLLFQFSLLFNSRSVLMIGILGPELFEIEVFELIEVFSFHFVL